MLIDKAKSKEQLQNLDGGGVVLRETGNLKPKTEMQTDISLCVGACVCACAHAQKISAWRKLEKIQKANDDWKMFTTPIIDK